MSTTISGDTGVDKFEGTTIAGHVIDVKYFITTAMATGTGAIPYDNTIPQITEGTQYMALSYTPKKVGSLLKIDVVANYGCSSAGMDTMALFNGSANAIATSGLASAANVIPRCLTAFVTTSSLSAIPFTVRIGTNGATVTLNGSSGVVYFGGTLSSSITVTEIAQ